MGAKAREVTAQKKYDLAIVGGGVVGLGAALAASKAGARVVVLEREPRVLGASVQNFGHIGVTLQHGVAAGYARRTRELWLDIFERASIWHRRTGATVIARGDDELALIEEAGAQRDPGQMIIRNKADTLADFSFADERIVGSALLRDDLQVDPRTAVPALAEFVQHLGVTVRFGANVQSVEPGAVHLAWETIYAERVLLAVNANLDRFFPGLANEHGVQRCMLDMLAVDCTNQASLPMPVLTASSLLRYNDVSSPIAEAVRSRIFDELPKMQEFDINEMYTQRPDGMLIVGDTHRLGDAQAPFQPERAFEMLLDLARRLFGVPQLRVLERWQGVYAKAPMPFLAAEPLPGVQLASVTTGIGMTTGLGFAEHTVKQWMG